MKKGLVAILGLTGVVATGGLLWAKVMRKKTAGTHVGGASQQVVGKSGISWLLEPTGVQAGPAYGTQLWNVYAPPGTSGLTQYTPVLSFMQVGADQSTRSLAANLLTAQVGPELADLNSPNSLISVAITDLGIKKA